MANEAFSVRGQPVLAVATSPSPIGAVLTAAIVPTKSHRGRAVVSSKSTQLTPNYIPFWLPVACDRGLVSHDAAAKSTSLESVTSRPRRIVQEWYRALQSREVVPSSSSTLALLTGLCVSTSESKRRRQTETPMNESCSVARTRACLTSRRGPCVRPAGRTGGNIRSRVAMQV